MFYVGKLCSQLIDEDQLYNEKRIKIPTPHFVVFYTGIDDLPEEMTYKLSEMYEQKTDNPELELTIKVLNINHGMNQSLMRVCKILNDYSIYVSKEREFYEEYGSHEKAVRQESFDDGKEQGIVIGEERGMDDGIRIFIEDKFEDNIPVEAIIHKLMKMYELTREKAIGYIKQNLTPHCLLPTNTRYYLPCIRRNSMCHIISYALHT